MRVLITGTEGYLGCLLAPLLVEDGHEVVALDTGYYRRGWLYHAGGTLPTTLLTDLRVVDPGVFEGLDAVVHLAELSNDPAGALAPETTFDINHRGSVRLAELAKAAGASRFVYASSCSVYGIASDDFVDESSPVNPQTAYAECKVRVEQDVGAMADDSFSPVFLRNSTAYGASPRMRFDIVLNNLAGLAWTTRRIAMTSDGTPWRPIVHALDICRAFRCALTAPREAIHGRTFNVGCTEHNFRIREIAEIVAAAFPGCALSFGDPDPDNRSYRVNFDRIAGGLPGFACAWDPARGARQLHEVFERIGLDEATFRAPPFTRLKQLQVLRESGQIDEQFYWRAPGR